MPLPKLGPGQKFGSFFFLTHDKNGNRRPEYKKPKSERGARKHD